MWFLTVTSGTKPVIVSAGHVRSCTKERNEEVPFSMAIRNGELMHECFPKHSRMGTARMKEDNETEERREYGKKYSGHE